VGAASVTVDEHNEDDPGCNVAGLHVTLIMMPRSVVDVEVEVVDEVDDVVDPVEEVIVDVVAMDVVVEIVEVE
jgi:hypothetical protein